LVVDCDFYDYSGAAVSTESEDMPLWRIERCLFRSADQTLGIGVALNGLTDTNVIQRCEFQQNYVHVKLGHGGNNAYVANNDFLQYATPVDGVRRTMVWIVPAPQVTNSGAGLVITDNKFGNENQGPSDLRIAYVDEGDGEFFADRLPDYTADSRGFVTGHTIRGGLMNGAASLPVVYSTTPFIRGCSVTGLVFAGTLPSSIWELRTPTTELDPEALSNLAGPFHLVDRDFSPFPVSNQPGLCFLDDPNQTMDSWPQHPTALQGGAMSAGYVSLLQSRIAGFRFAGGATSTPVTDSVGGSDAVEAAVPANGVIYQYTPTAALQRDYPVWIEFELRRGSREPLEELSVTFGVDTAASGGSGQYLRRRFLPTDRWRPYRLLATSPQASEAIVLKFEGSTASQTGTLVQLGRVRMYHAREPLPADLVLPDAFTTTAAPTAGGGAPLPATPTGYLTIYINGQPRQVAFY
jgi:hypothetical protein